jgi:predicted secreted protein
MLSIKLKVGETYSFSVDGLGGAGYNWDYAIEQGHDVVTISQHSHAVPPKPKPGDIPSNFEAKIEYAIKAIKPGAAQVKFYLHRVWEKNKAFLRETVVHIEVTAH